MCIIVEKESLKIAQDNFTVYKKLNNGRPFHNHNDSFGKYKRGTLYVQNSGKVVLSKEPNYCEKSKFDTENGYYSKSSYLSERYPVEFIIPVGAEYYSSSRYSEFCSNKLIFPFRPWYASLRRLFGLNPLFNKIKNTD